MLRKILLLTAWSLTPVLIASAQVRYIADTAVDTETTQIAIEAKDVKIKKIRLIFETSGSTFAKEVPASRVLFVPVSLKVGANKFNIIVYDADDNIIPADVKVIEIVRSAKSGGSETGSFGTTSGNGDGKVLDEKRRPVENAEVTLLDKDGKLLETQITDNTGAYSFNTPIPKPEQTPSGSSYPKTVKVNKEEFYESERPAQTKDAYLRPITGRAAGETWRAVVGYEQAGASASDSARNLFFDFAMSVPVTLRSKENGGLTSFGPRMRVWGDVRLSSAPDPNADQKTLSEFITGFNGIVAGTKVNRVVKAFETTAGFEARLFSAPDLFLGLFSKAKHRFSVNVIAGGGIVTPLSPTDTEGKVIFQATDEARARFGITPDKQYIAFVSPNRDRFYRQYFIGLRMKTVYFDEFERPLDIHPANLDVTFGQNEAITGGGLNGGILRFDGFYPLPWGLRNYLYLYGTAQMKLTRANILDAPLFLAEAPAGTTFSGPDIGIVTLPTVNRDFYKIGVGVDVFKVVCGFINCGGQR